MLGKYNDKGRESLAVVKNDRYFATERLHRHCMAGVYSLRNKHFYFVAISKRQELDLNMTAQVSEHHDVNNKQEKLKIKKNVS